MAGPGELTVVCGRVDHNRRSLHGCAPERTDYVRRAVARGTSRTDVTNTAVQEGRTGIGEARAMRSREGMRTGEALRQPGRESPPDDRNFNAADVRQRGVSTEMRCQFADELKGCQRRGCENREVGSTNCCRR